MGMSVSDDEETKASEDGVTTVAAEVDHQPYRCSSSVKSDFLGDGRHLALEEGGKASKGGASPGAEDDGPQPYQSPSSVKSGSCGGSGRPRGRYAMSESSHIGSLHIAPGDDLSYDDDVKAARNAAKARKRVVVALACVVLVLVIFLAVSVAMLFEGRKKASRQAAAYSGGLEPSPQQFGEGPFETPPPDREGPVAPQSATEGGGGAVAARTASEGPSESPTSMPTTSVPTGPPTGPPTGSPTGAPTDFPTGAPTKPPTGWPTSQVLADPNGGDGNIDERPFAMWDPAHWDELAEMGCWDSSGDTLCCAVGVCCTDTGGFFC